MEWSGVEWSGVRLPFHMYDMLSVKSLVCGLWSGLFVEMRRERERERGRFLRRDPGAGEGRRGEEGMRSCVGKVRVRKGGREGGGTVCGFW